MTKNLNAKEIINSNLCNQISTPSRLLNLYLLRDQSVSGDDAYIDAS